MQDSNIWLGLHRWRWMPWFLVMAAVGLFAFLYMDLPRIAAAPVTEAGSTSNAKAVQFISASKPEIPWQVFASDKKVVAKQAFNPDQLFRFVGSVQYAGDEEPVHMANIEDMKTGRQRFLSRGQTFNGAKILEVHSDHVVINYDEKKYSLKRKFSGVGAADVADGKAAEEKVSYFDRPAIKENRFGKMIEENRWVVKKSALQEFHQKMLQRPRDLAQLFGSFHRSRDEEGEARGYTLKMQGERELLKAMDLQEGDTILQVNAMDMTSMKRGLFFISEFAKGNVNTFVFNVERNGEIVQKVYYVR